MCRHRQSISRGYEVDSAIMCGRFTLHTPFAQATEIFQLPGLPVQELKPRYNIAPSRDIPIIRDTDSGREMVMARWGLIPGWSKESRTKYSTINARIESVAEKPTYRTPIIVYICHHADFKIFCH